MQVPSYLGLSLTTASLRLTTQTHQWPFEPPHCHDELLTILQTLQDVANQCAGLYRPGGRPKQLSVIAEHS